VNWTVVGVHGKPKDLHKRDHENFESEYKRIVEALG
jgi:hypothetical protein